MSWAVCILATSPTLWAEILLLLIEVRFVAPYLARVAETGRRDFQPRPGNDRGFHKMDYAILHKLLLENIKYVPCPFT